MKGAAYLSEGLMREFGGAANEYKEEIGEDGNLIKSAVVTTPDFNYTDRYISARVTSGEERLTAKNLEISRRYKGYIEDIDVLEPLGITETEVFQYLTLVVLKFGHKTRLDTNVETRNGPWEYKYTVDHVTSDDIIKGTERIFYEGKQVFIHSFEIEVTEG